MSSRILLQLNILLCCLISTVMISITVPSAFAEKAQPGSDVVNSETTSTPTENAAAAKAQPGSAVVNSETTSTLTDNVAAEEDQSRSAAANMETTNAPTGSVAAAVAEEDPFKDRSAEFYYTEYSNLTWRHGKECVSQFHPSRDCFWLTQDPAGIKYDRIGVPESKSQQYALAKESQSGLWVVVNLKGFQSLVRENDAEKALASLTALGLLQTRLANADDPFGPFQETGESYMSNQFRGLTLFWPYILLGLGLLYGFIEYVKYAIRSNRAARYRD